MKTCNYCGSIDTKQNECNNCGSTAQRKNWNSDSFKISKDVLKQYGIFEKVKNKT